MLTHATCDGSGVYCYHDQEQDQPDSAIDPGETLILIPRVERPEIRFTVPICPWQGNGS